MLAWLGAAWVCGRGQAAPAGRGARRRPGPGVELGRPAPALPLSAACNMICCYADELKEGFYPYVEQVGAAECVLWGRLAEFGSYAAGASGCCLRSQPPCQRAACAAPSGPAAPRQVTQIMVPLPHTTPTAGHPDHGPAAQVLLQRGGPRLRGPGAAPLALNPVPYGIGMRWEAGVALLQRGGPRLRGPGAVPQHGTERCTLLERLRCRMFLPFRPPPCRPAASPASPPASRMPPTLYHRWRCPTACVPRARPAPAARLLSPPTHPHAPTLCPRRRCLRCCAARAWRRRRGWGRTRRTCATCWALCGGRSWRPSPR